MKISNVIYIILLVISFGCKKGETGDIGPIGEKGATGDAGANNTTVGPVGDKGAIGNTGVGGIKGIQGSPGAAGVGNLITTDWKITNWRYASEGIFIGEVDFPELTQNIIDKSLIFTYFRINSNSTGRDELPQGIVNIITVGGLSYRFENNGYKIGKAMLIHSSTSSASPETIVNNLNNLSIEIRLSIIK